MIHDSLENTGRYASIHPSFGKVFDYIRTTDFSQLKDGKQEIDGDKVYASISTVCAKDETDAKLETHNKYIDIQLPLLGVETIAWKAGKDLHDIDVPYDAEKDIAFFGDRPTSYTKIYPGEFTIYFPEDGHAPCIGEGSIRKVVFKVLI